MKKAGTENARWQFALSGPEVAQRTRVAQIKVDKRTVAVSFTPIRKW